MISGSTAAEIAGHVRDLVAAGELTPGASLPPIRELARSIGVNRNTVAAAYRLLVAAGTAETNGRSGTAISRVPALDSEGLGADGRLGQPGERKSRPGVPAGCAPSLARTGVRLSALRHAGDR